MSTTEADSFNKMSRFGRIRISYDNIFRKLKGDPTLNPEKMNQIFFSRVRLNTEKTNLLRITKDFLRMSIVSLVLDSLPNDASLTTSSSPNSKSDTLCQRPWNQ